MKIACLISSLRLGGAERQLTGLAAELQKAGHEVCVITYRKGNFFKESLDLAGVAHHHIGGSGRYCEVISGISRQLRDSGTEVLISFRAGTNKKACLVKKRCPDVRLIVSERNFNLKMYPHDAFRFLLYRRYADKVVCNSHSQESFIRKHCPALADKLVAIPNFVDTDSFSPGGGSAYSGPLRILVTARVCRRKNTLKLIKAAKILKDRNIPFRISWYGYSGASNYKSRCARLIERFGLQDDFLLFPATHELRNLYCNSDFFCLPSLYEGTSNSIAEALACGIPVACSRVGDNTIYVREGQTGFLFEPESPEDIAGALERAAASTADKRREMSALCVATARSSFDVTRFTNSFGSILSIL